jgi:raffinose/stachyose/melibiose transport system permease protein
MAQVAGPPRFAAAFRRRFIQKRRLRAPLGVYLFIAPSILLLAVFSYYPIFSAFYHSFFNWDGVNEQFVGFDNFRMMLTDDALATSVPHVLFLAVAAVTFALTLPLLAAELIFNLRSERWRFRYRVLFTIPMVIPWIVTVLVWQFLYDPIDGPINRFFLALGLERFARAWLGEPQTALWAIALVGFPFVAGLNLLIYLAGLNNISTEVLDATKLDGAKFWQRFLYVDIPLIRGQVRLIVILTTITQIQNFAPVLILTKGGPGYSTMVPGMWMYQNAFVFGKMGYASAIGVVLFAVMLVLTAMNMRIIRASDEYEPGR